MTEKKEIWFIGIGLAAGGFITIFSDFFQYLLTPLFPDVKASVLIKTLSGTLGIVAGLIILKLYSKYPPKKIKDDKKSNTSNPES